MNTLLIGISGKKMSGKDALCLAICRAHGLKARRIAFADALKQEVSIACNVSRSFIEENKAQFRPILQWWGTNFKRHFHGDDYWVKQTLAEIVEAMSNGFTMIVIPDVRFQTEATTIKDCGGYLVRIARPTQLIDNHISETDLDNYKGFDHIVLNNGTLQDLDNEALTILNKIKNK
jgi:hypothetical protein